MRTQADRVSSLHERMEARRRIRERRKTGALSAAASALAACLFLMIYGEGMAHVGGTAGPYSGATMLFEGAGAYVLVALLAFMVGVVVTVVCIHQQRSKRRRQEEEGNEETEETI